MRDAILAELAILEKSSQAYKWPATIRAARSYVEHGSSRFGRDGREILEDLRFATTAIRVCNGTLTPRIQRTIEDYLALDWESGQEDVSTATLRTFVGMLETGEATPGDFEAVAGRCLRDLVVGAKNDGRFERRKDESTTT